MKQTEDKHKVTKKKFKDALDRLINKRVVNIVLRKRLASKGAIKINRRTLELEANMSAGSLRHYPDIVEMINAVNRTTVGTSNTKKAQEAKLAKLKKDLKELKKSLAQTKSELNRYKLLSQTQSAQFHMVLEEMLSVLTAEQKEKFFIQLEEEEFKSSKVINIFHKAHPKE